MAHVSAVGTVAIPVTDQDRAVAFYVDTLGFELRLDAPLPQLGGRWIVVGPSGSTTSLALVPATEQTPAGTDTGIRFATTDAAAAHTAFTAQGVATDDLLAWPGLPPMFTFRDPDNNTFYLVQD